MISPPPLLSKTLDAIWLGRVGLLTNHGNLHFENIYERRCGVFVVAPDTRNSLAKARESVTHLFFNIVASIFWLVTSLEPTHINNKKRLHLSPLHLPPNSRSPNRARITQLPKFCERANVFLSDCLRLNKKTYINTYFIFFGHTYCCKCFVDRVLFTRLSQRSTIMTASSPKLFGYNFLCLLCGSKIVTR